MAFACGSRGRSRGHGLSKRHHGLRCRLARCAGLVSSRHTTPWFDGGSGLLGPGWVPAGTGCTVWVSARAPLVLRRAGLGRLSHAVAHLLMFKAMSAPCAADLTLARRLTRATLVPRSEAFSKRSHRSCYVARRSLFLARTLCWILAAVLSPPCSDGLALLVEAWKGGKALAPCLQTASQQISLLRAFCRLAFSRMTRHFVASARRSKQWYIVQL